MEWMEVSRSSDVRKLAASSDATIKNKIRFMMYKSVMTKK